MDRIEGVYLLCIIVSVFAIGWIVGDNLGGSASDLAECSSALSEYPPACGCEACHTSYDTSKEEVSYIVEEVDGSTFGDSYTCMKTDYIENKTEFTAIFKYTLIGEEVISREYFEGYLDDLSNCDDIGNSFNPKFDSPSHGREESVEALNEIEGVIKTSIIKEKTESNRASIQLEKNTVFFPVGCTFDIIKEEVIKEQGQFYKTGNVFIDKITCASGFVGAEE